MHHLFKDLDNSIVILGIDKSQIAKTIDKTFGAGTETDKYLKKFIDFEMQLDIGRIENGFTEKYQDYFSLFNESLVERKLTLEPFFSALFADIDIRTQEHMIARIKTIHSILFPNEKKDYTFACLELLWLVLVDYYGLNSTMPILYNTTRENHGFHLAKSKNDISVFSKYIKEYWNSNLAISHDFSGNISFVLSDNHFHQLLIWYLYQFFKNKSFSTQYVLDRNRVGNQTNNSYENTIQEFRKVIELLKIIK